MLPLASEGKVSLAQPEFHLLRLGQEAEEPLGQVVGYQDLGPREGHGEGAVVDGQAVAIGGHRPQSPSHSSF